MGARPERVQGILEQPLGDRGGVTSDGWFRTGDIGYTDEDGYLFIVERLKDIVISGGENVFPAEVENVLGVHPQVEDVAVIGVPDEKWGEAVCAVVAFRGEEQLDLEQVREYLTGKIARYKLPTRMVVLDTVPRNGAGKLDKPTILKMVAEQDDMTTTAASPFTEAISTLGN